jgi:hypothetical protein
MSVDKLQQKDKANKDANWSILAEHAKSEMKRLQKQVYRLRKSFIFFNQQYESGVQFPVKKTTRHVDLS